MSFNYNENPRNIPEFLQSLIKLNELQRITDRLDDDLANSQEMMRDIKSLFDSMPDMQNLPEPVIIDQEQDNAVEQFLEASPPRLLMEDMPQITDEVDLDEILAQMKVYTEELRKKFDLAQPRTAAPDNKVEYSQNIDLDSYVSSLTQSLNRLSNIKLKKCHDANRNAELEAKLQLYCDNVNSFIQMVEAFKTQGEPTTMTSTDAFKCDNSIKKILADTDELIYLRKI